MKTRLILIIITLLMLFFSTLNGQIRSDKHIIVSTNIAIDIYSQNHIDNRTNLPELNQKLSEHNIRVNAY